MKRHEKYDDGDSIGTALEKTMVVMQFPYANDARRPFRTIFVVGGLKVTPMRPHKE
jgi:hypothetical protein